MLSLQIQYPRRMYLAKRLARWSCRGPRDPSRTPPAAGGGAPRAAPGARALRLCSKMYDLYYTCESLYVSVCACVCVFVTLYYLNDFNGNQTSVVGYLLSMYQLSRRGTERDHERNFLINKHN